MICGKNNICQTYPPDLKTPLRRSPNLAQISSKHKSGVGLCDTGIVALPVKQQSGSRAFWPGWACSTLAKQYCGHLWGQFEAAQGRLRQQQDKELSLPSSYSKGLYFCLLGKNLQALLRDLLVLEAQQGGWRALWTGTSSGAQLRCHLCSSSENLLFGKHCIKSFRYITS